MTEWKPIADWHLVELVLPLEMSTGGIALPSTMQMNDTTAVVLASGPGIETRCGKRSVQWVEPGCVVFIDQTQALPLEGRQCFIRDRDLLALMDGEEIIPLNDFVMVDPDAGETEQSGLYIPDAWRRLRARSGIVNGFGPGRVELRGRSRGIRRRLSTIIHMEDDLIGRRVYWQHESNAFAVGRHSLSALLVRAEHLIAMEANSDADCR